MNGLANQPVEQQSTRLGGPAVEAKRVLIQVIVQMRTLDCSLMSSKQPSLQQRSDSIGQRQKVVTQLRSFPNDRMLVAQRSKSVIAPPPVRMHFRPRFDHLLHGGLQTLASRVSHPAQTHSANASFGLLGRDDHQSFSTCSTASLSRTFSANENLIDLDHARKSVSPRADHGSSKFMQPLPSGMITAQAQNALQPQSTHAVFLIGDIPHGFKPKTQRLVRVVEQSACRCRNLMVALLAPEKTSLHRPSLCRLASRANKSTGPSQASNIVSAGLFGGKQVTKLKNSRRIRFHVAKLSTNPTRVKCIALIVK